MAYNAAGNPEPTLTVKPGHTSQYNERISCDGVDGRLGAAEGRSAANGGSAMTGHLAFETYR